MENGRRPSPRPKAKNNSARQDVWSQDLPFDLNSLYLQNSNKQEPVNTSPSSRNRNSRSLRRYNNEVKLEYSKSCEVPSLLADKSALTRRKAKRTVSAPETLQVPAYGLEKFSFERPANECNNMSLCNNCSEDNSFGDNLHLGLKLPSVRITSTNCYANVRNKNKTTSTAGIDFRLPYVKDKKFYR